MECLNSLTTKYMLPQIKSASDLMLPFPATDSASIFTTTVNSQDVMVQVNEECGTLWSDEGSTLPRNSSCNFLISSKIYFWGWVLASPLK